MRPELEGQAMRTDAASASASTNGEAATRSLEGLHGTVPVPPASSGFLAAVAGVCRARLFWSASATWTRATGAPTSRPGRQYRYDLLWVVALASLMAIIMQVISARLGVVTGKDLAQACRDFYPAWTPLAQLAALRTRHCRLRPGRGARQRRGHQPALPGIPLFWAVLITAFDVLLLLALQGLGMRFIEADHSGAGRHHRRLLLHRDFRAAADASRLPGDGAGAASRPGFARRA